MFKQTKRNLSALAGIGFSLALYSGLEREEPFDLGIDRDIAEDSSAYSFGGSCPSNGAWTQKALAETQNIRAIVQRLKDIPECKGIGNVVQGLDSAAKALNLPEREMTGESGNLIESLPGELEALRKGIFASGGKNASATALLAKTSVVAAQAGAAQASQPGMPVITNYDAAVKALYQRTKRATSYGLEAMTQVMGQLPAYEQCLIGHPNEGMLLLSATIKTAAAFAASGEGVGQRLGNSIAALANMVREQKFTRVLRDLNKTEFWFSVSCILESTTKSWCDNRNNLALLNYSRSEFQRNAKAAKFGDRDPNGDSALEGYYLMVREIPIIAQWLRSVKLGTDPKNSSDANFQGESLTAISEYQKSIKKLQGQFAEQKSLIESVPDLATKRNTIYSLLGSIVGSILSGSGKQFFTMSYPDIYIPFYLVGLSEVPAPVRTRTDGGIATGWSNWMQSAGKNGSYQSFFDDPDTLLRTIERQLNSLVEQANIRASAYFRQRLVIDLQNLVGRTLTGQYISVHESLEHVDRYLTHLETRLGNNDNDTALIPLIRDTRRRISTILNSYDEIVQLGKDLKSGMKIEPEALKTRTKEASQKMIDSVFAELEVIYLTDVMLTNRISTLITADLSNLIRNPRALEKHQREFLVIAQEHLLEKLIEVHGVNPTDNGLDMRQAQNVNSRNMLDLEEIFGDTIFVALEELNEAAHGRSTSASALNRLSDKRLRAESKKARKMMAKFAWMDLAPMSPFGGSAIWGWLNPASVVKANHEDLYTRPVNPLSQTVREDEFQSVAQLRAKFCAQTLAFESRTRYIEFCKGAVLKSHYSPEKGYSALDLNYDDYLPNAAYDRVIKSNPKKIALRNCALNDFQMKNLVRFLEERDRREDRVSKMKPPVPRPSVLPSMVPVEAPVSAPSTRPSAVPSTTPSTQPVSIPSAAPPVVSTGL